MHDDLEMDLFIHEYWRKAVYTCASKLHLKASHIDFSRMPEYFATLQGMEDDFFVFRDGVACKSAVFTKNGTIDWQTVGKLFKEEACTLYVRNLERYDRTLLEICSEISLFSGGRRAFVNLFVTPGSSVGLPVHFDLTDFFVLQLHGNKQWRFWNPPSQHDITFDRQVNARVARKISAVTAPELVIEMNVGMLAYVPFAMIHEPISGQVGSVHLTIGVLDENEPEQNALQ